MDDMAQPFPRGERTPSRFNRSAIDLKTTPPVYHEKMRFTISTRPGRLRSSRTCSLRDAFTFVPRGTVRTGTPSGSRMTFSPASLLRTI